MSAHNCEKSARPGFLTDGYRQDGELWTCPDCGKMWIHTCDEAEGCYWTPDPKREDEAMIEGLSRRERLNLFLAGVMQQAESIALRHPTDSKIMTRDRLMTSRIPGMVEELEALLKNNPATSTPERR